MLKKLLLSLLVVRTIALLPMEQTAQDHNTYNGQTITAENLCELAPTIPEELKEKTTDWAEKNKIILATLAATPQISNVPTLQLYGQFYQNFLLTNNLTSLGKLNYIFKPDESYVVRISHLKNKLFTLYKLVTGNDPYSCDFAQASFDTITTANVPTHQHTSQVAHYLRLKEAIETKHLEHIKTPASYLLHIPEREDACNDHNYVVVQEAIDSNQIVHLNELPEQEQIEILKNQQPMEDLHAAITYAALWNANGDNVLVNKNMPAEIWYTDLEQPNNSGPFFYAGPEGHGKCQHDVSVGLEEMGKKIQALVPEKYEAWQALSREK